ncbi:hypothetical protein EYC84_007041 [Monilinia fructicola]|uniref:Uncharacterized protein n=1 Tax=Monilinia fructicola TaxID=38448 RepID=A0A5M9K9V1_MONFR|nr:hypothetical protein EYC84_007041 [Monilinia fructicola]
MLSRFRFLSTDGAGEEETMMSQPPSEISMTTLRVKSVILASSFSPFPSPLSLFFIIIIVVLFIIAIYYYIFLFLKYHPSFDLKTVLHPSSSILNTIYPTPHHTKYQTSKYHISQTTYPPYHTSNIKHPIFSSSFNWTSWAGNTHESHLSRSLYAFRLELYRVRTPFTPKSLLDSLHPIRINSFPNDRSRRIFTDPLHHPAQTYTTLLQCSTNILPHNFPSYSQISNVLQQARPNYFVFLDARIISPYHLRSIFLYPILISNIIKTASQDGVHRFWVAFTFITSEIQSASSAFHYKGDYISIFFQVTYLQQNLESNNIPKRQRTDIRKSLAIKRWRKKVSRPKL